MLRRARCEPKRRWTWTPRSVGVSIRWRYDWGRTSGARWVAPFVCPLAWQSKHVDPAARPGRTAVLGRVELLLRERRHEQPQPLELLGVEDAVEQLEVVLERDDLAPRDVAEVRARRQVDRGRELGEEAVGQVEIEVIPREVAPLLPPDLVDLEPGEDHAPLGVVGVRQGQEARREEVLLADLLGRHRAERLPGRAGRQPDPHALLDRLAARHGDAGRRPVAPGRSGRGGGPIGGA